MGLGGVIWGLLRWGGVWWWRCRGWVVYPVGIGREEEERCVIFDRLTHDLIKVGLTGFFFIITGWFEVGPG